MGKKISLSLIAALSVTTLSGVEFKPVGYKAVGMGGTGVASTRGSLSGYYNPALVRFSDYTTELSINGGVRVRESNLIDNMDKLSDLEFGKSLSDFKDLAEKSEVVAYAKLDNNVLKFSDAASEISVTEDVANEIRGLEEGQFKNIQDTNNNNTIKIEKENGKLIVKRSASFSSQSEDKTKLDKAVENMKKAIDIITNDIGKRNGFMLSVTPSLSAQISDAFALGIYGNVDVGFRLNIDPNYNKLITKDEDNQDVYYEYDYNSQRYEVKSQEVNGQVPINAYKNSSLEYANDNGINYIEVNSMALTEFPLTYGRAYDFNSGSWSFGFNIKPMMLTTYYKQFFLGESSDDATDDIKDYKTTYDSTIGLDLGVAYRPKGSDITFGLVGKNLNSPTFKVDKSSTGVTEDYKIDPMARIGVSIPMWNNNFELAFDADLTENDTLVKDEKSQYMGAGLEFHPSSWFALRVGAMQDIAAENFDDGTIVTAGLGFGLKWLQVDLSVMASTNQGEYDGGSIPRYVAANFSLISRWGSGYNRKEAPKEKTINKQQRQNITNEEKIRIKQDSERAFQELDRS